MRFSLSGSFFQLTWQFLDREWQEDDNARTLVGFYARVGKWERGHLVKLRGTLASATLSYYTWFNGNRTGWQIQSPVQRIY